MKLPLLVVIACVMLTTAKARTLPADSPAAIFDAAAAHYKSVRTLRLRVENKVTVSQKPGANATNATNTLISFERPDRWRLETTLETPVPQDTGFYPYVFVADGRTYFVSRKNGDTERQGGAEYGRKLDKWLARDSSVSHFLSVLISGDRFQRFFDGINPKGIRSMKPIVLEGRSLEGFRVEKPLEASDFQKSEDTLWFDVNDHTLRRVQSRVIGWKLSLTVLFPVVEHEENINLPADAFVPPPPFKPDVVEPEALELLRQAARFYHGLQGISFAVTTRDLEPVSSDSSQDSSAKLFFRRPNRFRLDYKTLSPPDEGFFMVDGRNVFINNSVSDRRPYDFSAQYELRYEMPQHHSEAGVAGGLIWKMLMGQSLLLDEENRGGLSQFMFYTLRRLPPTQMGGKQLEGIQLRVNEEQYDHRLDETVMWFDLQTPKQPVLRRVQWMFKTPPKRGIGGTQGKTVDDITDVKLNPNLPDAFFRPSAAAIP